ncbi:MAG: hypothetical protein WAL10_19800, partial [Acetobacteraceae bacterium]
TILIGAHVFGLPPDADFLAPRWGLWDVGGLVRFFQPDDDPERPLTRQLGTPDTTAMSGGNVQCASARLDGEGTVYAKPEA